MDVVRLLTEAKADVNVQTEVLYTMLCTELIERGMHGYVYYSSCIFNPRRGCAGL